ncbi:MAG: hypothetical protein KGN02_11290 [bacterium]|nr:hypothetical protein [bacterium]
MSERPPEQRIESYPHRLLDAWRPALPDGRIERIYTHWSGHDYASVFPSYHICVALAPNGGVLVVETNDVRANMRDVYAQPDLPYAAHTYRRNSFALGVSMMAMLDATPHDFGRYPLTEALVHGLCVVTARLARHYGVPLDAEHVMSHAEAAVLDGYFGCGDDERWDVARLRAEPRALEARDAREIGDALRTKMRGALE